MEPTSFTHYRSLRSAVPSVWPCLTRPELLAGWIGEADMELRPDGALVLKLWNGDAIHGRVIAAVPTARLELAWKPFDFDPESHVVWRLSATDRGRGSRSPTMGSGAVRSATTRGSSGATRWRRWRSTWTGTFPRRSGAERIP